MSGGGGNNDALLGTALSVGAAIAAPELAPVIFGEGAGLIATAATGAVLGGAANAATGRDVGQGVLTGGLGGAAAGYFGGADNALAGEISSNAAAGTGPGANLTQIGGQPFSQSAYDASSAAADSAGYGGALNQVPGVAPIPPSANIPNVATQPFDAAGYSGAANQVPGTQSGYQQVGANTPQANPNTTTSPAAGANNVKPDVSTNLGDKGLLGTGITGKQAMVGLGGLALWNAIQQENKKYGVPTTQNQVPSNLNYTLQNHAPMQLTRSYADGGPVSLNTSPIKQQINANAIGANQMFPQPGVHSNQYANASNIPVSANMLTPTTDTAVDPYTGQQKMAAGGIAGNSLGGYAAGGNPRLLKGPGDGMSDNIPATIGDKQPARLADGEFVVPADVVSHLGNGSTDAGANKLHTMMDNVRKARTGKKSQGKEIKADKFMPKFADGGQVDPVAAAAQAAQAANQNFVAQAAPAIPAQTMVPQGLGATAPAQTATPAAAPASMADQYAAYQNKYAQQYAPTNENFVREAYMNTLGRAPDAEGAAYWGNQISSGALTPQQVAQQIAGSKEATNVGNIRDAMSSLNTPTMTPGSVNSLINSAYQGNLGRAPDAGGQAYYSQLLQSGQMTPQQFIDALKGSSEYGNKNATATADTGQSAQDQFNQLMRNYQSQQNQG